MDPYLFDHPELQLKDANGNRSPSRLDITNPDAFRFYTELVDEWSALFDSPYWMVSADEYLSQDQYAKKKFVLDAVPQDAFVDFVNRVDKYVRDKGTKLRMWNDGIPTNTTVELNSDITVEPGAQATVEKCDGRHTQKWEPPAAHTVPASHSTMRSRRWT